MSRNATDCTAFLQWALPRLRLRWRGFRRVRGQVCKRLARRMDALDLEGFDAYRELLAREPEEWRRLDELCGVTISRFWRDAVLFDALFAEVIPALARGKASLACWCAGAASGEEPYSLLLGWRHRPVPSVELRVTASERDPAMTKRARAGLYPGSSLRELPAEWRETDFVEESGRYRLDPKLREAVAWRSEDLRERMPDGPFELVLCRNLAFTYFDESLQRRVLDGLRRRAADGAALVLGRHESLPDAVDGWLPWPGVGSVWRACDGPGLPFNPAGPPGSSP